MLTHMKIRNTFRFLLGNINDNFVNINLNELDLTKLPELEQFMLHKIFVLMINLKIF